MEELGVSWEKPQTPDFQYLSGWWWYVHQRDEDPDPDAVWESWRVMGLVRDEERLKECFLMGWRDAEGEEECRQASKM